MIICPNFSNPDVAREFEELKLATSEKAAYAIWSLNNGNAIDKAPNGAESKLFADLLNHFNGNRRDAIVAKSRVYQKSFLNWFGDWINDSANASKVVDENGEPLIVYHGSEEKFTVFNVNSKNRGSLTPVIKKGFYFSNKRIASQYASSKLRNDYFKLQELLEGGFSFEEIAEAFGANRYDDESMDRVAEYITSLENETIDFRDNLYAVFLNIKQPVQYDLKGEIIASLSESQKETINNSEGAILNNVDETTSRYRGEITVPKMYVGTDYIVFEPDQIKSATDNDGGFSTENNDIYRHISKRVNNIAHLSDEIQKEGITGPDAVEHVVDFLKNKFPELKIHFLDSVLDIQREDIIEQTVLTGIFNSNKSVKSLVYHGEVYLIRDRLSKLGGQIASEEILHMLIKTLQTDNKQLFKSLLEEAKRSFKKLTKEIESIYEKAGTDTIENEIVTQALARYVNRDIQENKHRKFAELVKSFVDWLKRLLINSADVVGDTVYIDPTQLRNITLQQLSDLINAEDTRFDINTDSDEILLHNSNDSIVKQMYDIGVQMDTERQSYINSVLNQYVANNPQASAADLSRIRNNARKQFNIDRSDRILHDEQISLAQAFGLLMNSDGYYVSQETTLKKLMLEFFINSLLDATFRAYNLENLNRTKYQQVGSVQNVTSLANLLYQAIYEGDLVTLDKELARDYVRMFWGSDLIQSALESLDDGNKTSEQLENDLVGNMTRTPVAQRNQNIVTWFNNIWQQLKTLVQSVFGQHAFTDQQKEDILKAVDAAFMLAEDLDYTNNNNVIYDRADGNYSTSGLLSEKDKQVLSSIKSGIKTRLKSQLARNVKNQRLIADLKSRLEVIDSKDQDSVDDVFNIIQDFLVTANQEIGKTRYYIDRTLLIPGNMNNWNPQEINFILQDLIGYYKNLLDIVSSMFNDNESSINKLNASRVANDPNAIDLQNLASELSKSIDSLQRDYNSSVVKPYVRKILSDYVNQEDAITDKQTFIYNMERWLEQDSSYGDLAGGEVIIGMASRSKSPVVRIVEQMISAAEFETSRQVLKKGHELVRLYNKIRPTGSQVSPTNWQKRFMEFDRDGVSTGYFVREINAGQFYRDKDKKEEELRAKYGLTADENGNTIFPDEDFVANDSIYNKYNDELDEWLDKHADRRYTIDYYKTRRRYLSPKTILAQQQLLRQIDLLLDKARMSSGYVDLSKLTQNERRQLNILRKQKRDLGSHYIFTEISGGILRVEEKTGDSLKMANEITAWNKYITDKVKYKPNWTAFNEAKQSLINAGASQQEIDAFERNNTTLRITSEFYDLLTDSIGKSATNDELEELKHRHSEIMNALKERLGAGSLNLNKLGLGINTDQSGWRELQRIEQRMADIKRDLRRQGITGQKGNGQLTFNDIAKMMYATVSDTNNTSYLEYLIQQWRLALVSNTNLNNIFNSLFTYTDEKGVQRYLKAFKYLTPSNWTINVNGNVIKCIESLPGSEYSELDESSPFVNTNFKKDGPSLQAKAYDNNGNRLYKNEAYEQLTSDEKVFLTALIDAMSEANEMIPNKALTRDEMLPQISGRTMSVLANTMMAKEWSTALKYPFRKFGVKYAETEDTVSTNVDLARRPDGTVVNNIPIRFIRKLDNPATQTTDVLGSVLMYYDMACNYMNKSKNLPTLELIKYSIDPAISSTANKLGEQYKKVENLLDQRYYGKETSFGFDSNEKITDAKQRVIQGTKTIRNLASVAMLGVNFTTIEVGYIDAMCSMIADSIGGKYITGADIRKAFLECIRHTGKMLSGLGNPVVDDKLVAAMQYNLLSRSNSEMFSMTDKFKLDRFVHQHLLMGGYTITDYMVNSMMLTATYNHYKLITDPKTNKQRFYSKTDAINEFTKLGYTEKEAIRLWKKSNTTLWDAYDCVNGDFILKSYYKDIVTKKLENRIAGRLRDRTAMYNGIIPMSEKAKLQQNVFGSFITLMRNFYVNTYWDRFKTGGDYVTEDGDHNITWTSEYKRDDLGLVNLETGEFEGAVFKDFARGMYKLTMNTKAAVIGAQTLNLTREQKYALTRSVSELLIIGGMLFAMLWSIGFARSNNYDDDKEPAWKLNLIGDGPLLEFKTEHMSDKFADWFRWKMALLATRGFTERLTPWWAPTALEPLTSPTVATSYLDDIGVMWGLVIDLFSQRTTEEIKSGGYKHMTRGTRDLLKLFSAFGVDNLVRSWHTDGIKSTLNYYRGLTPTNAIVPSQSEWNEAHGLGKHGSKPKGNKKKSKVGEFAE